MSDLDRTDPAGPTRSTPSRPIDTHLTIVAALHIAFGVIGLLSLLFALVFVAGTGIAMRDMPEVALATTLGVFVFLLLAALSLPGIIGGIGVVLRKGWARVLLLVVSFVHLLNIPFGTALGVYTLWVLLQDDARRAFSPAASR